MSKTERHREGDMFSPKLKDVYRRMRETEAREENFLIRPRGFLMVKLDRNEAPTRLWV